MFPVVTVIIGLVLTAASILFAVYTYRRSNRVSVEVMPISFRPAQDLIITAGVGNDWEGEPFHVVEAKTGTKPAALTVKLKNTGAKPVSIDGVAITDSSKKHLYGASDSPLFRLEVEDIKTTEIPMMAENCEHFMEPPTGESVIEVATATKTFRSKPFRFTDLFRT
jgi:hypothetical protein